tara:strand:- start:30 stop:428 length:399 start_codon:yes stop_codon:yes gene_type:complete
MNIITTYLFDIYESLRRRCRKKPSDVIQESLLYCRNNNLEGLDELFKNYKEYIHLDLCLNSVAEQGNKEMVKYLIDKGATNLNIALGIACKHNRYEVAELLYRKGADRKYGLRENTSQNIIQMLFRNKNDNK